MKKHNSRNFVLIARTTFCSILAFISTHAFATGFQSFEQNAADLGDAYAGQAAYTGDASVEFNNPAGMTDLPQMEISTGSVLVAAHARFTGTSLTDFYGNHIEKTAPTNVSYPFGSNVLPDIHFVTPLPHNLAFGFGITVPFGLESKYPDDSFARYFATRSQISTYNFSPSLAYKFNDYLSIGAGFDVEYLKANLDQQIDVGEFLGDPHYGLAYDASMKNAASDVGYGWNMGLLFEPDDLTKFGFSYRSFIRYNLRGNSSIAFSSLLTDEKREELESYGLKSGKVRSTFILPDTAIFSLSRELNHRLTLRASVDYTNWRVFHQLNLHFENGLPDITVPENFDSTWRYALGFNYQATDHLQLRVGTAFDNTPESTTTRTIAIPDNSRLWFSGGLTYAFNAKLSMDAGYSYIMINHGHVNQSDPMHDSLAKITGYYDQTHANLVGLQLNLKL